MLQENNSIESINTSVVEAEQRVKSPEELEEKFGLPKVFGSLALAAAALSGGMQNAEAGGSMIMENTPTMNSLKAELSVKGVQGFEVVRSLGLKISTDRGDVHITKEQEDTRPAEQIVSSALEGVSANQFLGEIERQNTRAQKILEQLETKNGIFRISISPYAQEVLKQNNVSYGSGFLKKGRYSIDLTGGNEGTPNTECKITGWGEFKNFVIADCLELKVVNGRPVISSVKYKLNGTDLSVEEIKK